MEVDWSTLFKTFYETVRVKVAVRDHTKIPKERLFEFSRKLHIVEFTVETDQSEGKGTKNGGGNDDDDGGDGKGGLDDEADDLYDTDTKKEHNPTTNTSNMKTPVHKTGNGQGGKTVGSAMMLDQDQQLITMMENNNPTLITDGGGGAGCRRTERH